MMEANSGSYTLTIDSDDEVPFDWSGVLHYPETKSERTQFQLFSNNHWGFVKPFPGVDDHKEHVVHGWLASCRPVTLIEPFYTSSGGGNLAPGFRQSTSISGNVGSLVEGAHVDGDDTSAISEVGFWSEALVAIAQMQACRKEAVTSKNDPPGTQRLSSEANVPGLGTLHFTIAYRENEHSHEQVDRAYTRLKAKNGIDIWTAQKWARFHLSFIDFLVGASAGEFSTSVSINAAKYHGPTTDKHLRLDVFPRTKADHFMLISLHLESPIDAVPRALVRAWQDDAIKRRIFAATTLRSGKLGVFERFTRTMAFLEKWLRERYPDYTAKQERYRASIVDYNEHLRTASKEVQAFAREFTHPRFPQKNSLKDLLVRAFQECQPLSLACGETKAQIIADLRNEIAHGSEPSGRGQLQELLLGSDIGLAIIELLTLKDIELDPATHFRPRQDRYGSQNGIYENRYPC